MERWSGHIWCPDYFILNVGKETVQYQDIRGRGCRWKPPKWGETDSYLIQRYSGVLCLRYEAPLLFSSRIAALRIITFYEKYVSTTVLRKWNGSLTLLSLFFNNVSVSLVMAAARCWMLIIAACMIDTLNLFCSLAKDLMTHILILLIDSNNIFYDPLS